MYFVNTNRTLTDCKTRFANRNENIAAANVASGGALEVKQQALSKLGRYAREVMEKSRGFLGQFFQYQTPVDFKRDNYSTFNLLHLVPNSREHNEKTTFLQAR